MRTVRFMSASRGMSVFDVRADRKTDDSQGHVQLYLVAGAAAAY